MRRYSPLINYSFFATLPNLIQHFPFINFGEFCQPPLLFQTTRLLIQVHSPGADPAFIIRGGPNSEHFLSNLRKLFKRDKFFLTTPSLIVKRNWVYINYKKKRLLTWNFFWVVSFLKKKPGADPEISRREGRELICLDTVYFMIILTKRGR